MEQRMLFWFRGPGVQSDSVIVEFPVREEARFNFRTSVAIAVRQRARKLRGTWVGS